MIRELQNADCDSYAALRRKALLNEPLAFLSSPDNDFASSAEAVREQLAQRPNATIFGAFRPNLVGAIGLYRDRHAKASHKVYLWGMYVEPRHRRQGLGSKLLHAAINYALALDDVTWVHLTVTSAAPDALALYEATGFRIWGTEPEALRHQDRMVVDHHMALRLSGGT